MTTGAGGTFALADLPVGAYVLTAHLAGSGTASMLVGVAGGATTHVSLRLEPAPPATTATLAGTVIDTAGNTVAGATVVVLAQDVTATTDASGGFELAGVAPGFVYLAALAPSMTYLDGETRHAVHAVAGTTTSGVEIVLSGRPTAAATWVGGAACANCHAGSHGDLIAGVAGAAHARFVTEGTSHLVYPEL